MHHFESNNVQFNYNGDYSGDIYVTNQEGEESVQTFASLSSLAQIEDAGGPYIRAVKEFVGLALINAAIRSLEQMDPAEALDRPWLKAYINNVS